MHDPSSTTYLEDVPENTYPGAFLVIEGADGVGKGTTLQKLVPLLREATGRDVVTVREPGGTAAGEKVRELLSSDVERDPETDLLLFSSSRRALITQVIRPALQEGKIVVADRFVLSTYAYQGGAQGVDFQDINDASRIAIGDVRPDRTAVLTLEPEEWQNRLQQRNKARDSRFETEQMLRAVQEEYFSLAERLPWTRAVSAEGGPEEVARRVLDKVALPVLREKQLLDQQTDPTPSKGRRGR